MNMTMSGKRSSLSIKDKICVLKKYDGLPKMSQREAAMVLNLPRTTLSKIIKSREEIEFRMKSAAAASHNRKRNRSGKNKVVEDALKMWFIAARASNTPINGPAIRQKAKEFSKEMGFGDFTASEGWLDRWKKRESIVFHSQKTNQLESKDARSEFTANNWINEEWPRLVGRFQPQDIYSANEAGLYFRALPEDVKGGWKKCPVAAERVTLLCCVSMAGEKKQLLVVGKSKRPKCFQGVTSLPTRYMANENAWMTATIFTEWLTTWDAELVEEGRSICLLVDNCPAHNPNKRLTNIEIVILPNLLHPCGRYLISNLKMLYRCELRSKIEKRLEDSESEAVTACIIARTITLLDAMHMLTKCWYLISPASIQSCFRQEVCSIYPALTIGGDWGGEFAINIPDGMIESEFYEWAAVDDSIPVTSFLSDSDLSIIEKVQRNGKKAENREKEESNEQEEEECDPTPTAKQMRAALRTICVGLERRGVTDFTFYYRLEDLVNDAFFKSPQIKSEVPDLDRRQVSSDLPRWQKSLGLL